MGKSGIISSATYKNKYLKRRGDNGRIRNVKRSGESIKEGKRKKKNTWVLRTCGEMVRGFTPY
jgi:hypothetical protein